MLVYHFSIFLRVFLSMLLPLEDVVRGVDVLTMLLPLTLVLIGFLVLLMLPLPEPEAGVLCGSVVTVALPPLCGSVVALAVPPV